MIFSLLLENEEILGYEAYKDRKSRTEMTLASAHWEGKYLNIGKANIDFCYPPLTSAYIVTLQGAPLDQMVATDTRFAPVYNQLFTVRNCSSRSTDKARTLSNLHWDTRL